MDTDETTSLVKGNGLWLQNSRSVMTSFIVMTVMFSINHACAVSCVGIASIAFEGSLAGASTGTLWLAYTCSALFTAIFVVDRLGPKRTLYTGLFLYCFYVTAYLVASLWSAVQWPVAIIGAFVSGIGAGWLWTAQGVYFARSSKWYAAASSTSVEKATSLFAGVFAAIYVGSEVVFKLLWKLSAIGESTDPCKESPKGNTIGMTVVFIIYAGAALASAIGMLFIREFPEPDADNAAGSKSEEGTPILTQFCAKSSAAIKLLFSDPKMGLIAGLNMTFGLGAAYVNHYLNGFVAKDAVGSSNVAFLEAIIPGAAAILSFPYSWATQNCVGKKWVMIWGCGNFIFAILLMLAIPDLQPSNSATGHVASMSFWLVLVYLVFGSARAVYEGINKAVFADFFPENKQGAFANAVVQNGGTASVAFFVWGWWLESTVFPDSCPNGQGGDYLANLKKELVQAQTDDNSSQCQMYKNEISDCESGHTVTDATPMGIVILLCATLSIVGIWFAFIRYEREKREAGDGIAEVITGEEGNVREGYGGVN